MLHSIMVIEVQYNPHQAGVKILQMLNDEHDVHFINARRARLAARGGRFGCCKGHGDRGLQEKDQSVRMGGAADSFSLRKPQSSCG
jgi:hypothetical protein